MKNIHALFWWIFIYHGWPLRFVRETAYEFYEAFSEVFVATWHLARIPFQPAAMLVAFIMDAGIREKLRAGRARKVVREDPVRLKGTISFGQ